MTHGHEVLHMMEGNSYANKQALINTTQLLNALVLKNASIHALQRA